MTETAVRAAIADALHAVAPEVDLARVDPESDLRQAIDIDSFDFLNVLIGLHERLGVDVPESDYGQLRSLNALVRYLTAAAPRSP